MTKLTSDLFKYLNVECTVIDISSSLKTLVPNSTAFHQKESIHKMFNVFSGYLQLYHKAPSAERSPTTGIMQKPAFIMN